MHGKDFSSWPGTPIIFHCIEDAECFEYLKRLGCCKWEHKNKEGRTLQEVVYEDYGGPPTLDVRQQLRVDHSLANSLQAEYHRFVGPLASCNFNPKVHWWKIQKLIYNRRKGTYRRGLLQRGTAFRVDLLEGLLPTLKLSGVDFGTFNFWDAGPYDFGRDASVACPLPVLHMYARVGARDCVQYLVSKGAPVSYQDRRGKTPLHHTTEGLLWALTCTEEAGDWTSADVHRHIECIEYLLHQCCLKDIVSLENEDGETVGDLIQEFVHGPIVSQKLREQCQRVNAWNEWKVLLEQAPKWAGQCSIQDTQKRVRWHGQCQRQPCTVKLANGVIELCGRGTIVTNTNSGASCDSPVTITVEASFGNANDYLEVIIRTQGTHGEGDTGGLTDGLLIIYNNVFEQKRCGQIHMGSLSGHNVEDWSKAQLVLDTGSRFEQDEKFELQVVDGGTYIQARIRRIGAASWNESEKFSMEGVVADVSATCIAIHNRENAKKCGKTCCKLHCVEVMHGSKQLLCFPPRLEQKSCHPSGAPSEHGDAGDTRTESECGPLEAFQTCFRVEHPSFGPPVTWIRDHVAGR